MELVHVVTGATKTVPDDADVSEMEIAGWQIVEGSRGAGQPEPTTTEEPEVSEPTEPDPHDAGGGHDEPAAEPEAQEQTQESLETEAEETGHAGLQEDEGATTAKAGHSVNEADDKS